MMLKEGNMITLQDGFSYGLLLETVLKEESYFLAVQLTSNEEPTDVFKVLKEMEKDDKTYVVEEKDPFILNKLIEDYLLLAEDVE